MIRKTIPIGSLSGEIFLVIDRGDGTRMGKRLSRSGTIARRRIRKIGFRFLYARPGNLRLRSAKFRIEITYSAASGVALPSVDIVEFREGKGGSSRCCHDGALPTGTRIPAEDLRERFAMQIETFKG